MAASRLPKIVPVAAKPSTMYEVSIQSCDITWCAASADVPSVLAQPIPSRKVAYTTDQSFLVSKLNRIFGILTLLLSSVINLADTSVRSP